MTAALMYNIIWHIFFSVKQKRKKYCVFL